MRWVGFRIGVVVLLALMLLQPVAPAEAAGARIAGLTTRGEPATAPPLAEIVSDPLGLAVEFAAARLGVAPADIIQLGYEQPFVTVDGARIWTGLFGARQRDDQLFVAVNMVTGEVLDQAGSGLRDPTGAETPPRRGSAPRPPSGATSWS